MHTNEQKHLLDSFQGHIDSRGGIFTPTTRRRLLGVRGEKNEQGRPDTPDFWQNVRDYTKAALRDLELLAWVAESDQLRDIFSLRDDFRDWDKDTQKYKRPDPVAYLDRLLGHEHPEEWRTQLGLKLASKGMEWRGTYSMKLTNPLIKDAFEKSKAAAELLKGDLPAAPSRALKTPKVKNAKN
jgi:hypothetical protein